MMRGSTRGPALCCVECMLIIGRWGHTLATGAACVELGELQHSETGARVIMSARGCWCTAVLDLSGLFLLSAQRLGEGLVVGLSAANN